MEKSLYHINQDYQNIVNQLEESEGELTPELEEALKISKEEIAIKSFNYIQFIKNRLAFIGQIDSEIERLQKLKDKDLKVIERLESNLTEAVKLHGDIKTGTYVLSLKETESLEVLDMESVPSKYINETTKTVTTKAVDKVKLKKAMKEDTDLFAAVNDIGARINKNQKLVIK